MAESHNGHFYYKKLGECDKNILSNIFYKIIYIIKFYQIMYNPSLPMPKWSHGTSQYSQNRVSALVCHK